MEEANYKYFINTIVAIARLFYLSEDKFLAQKLYKKLSEFAFEYIKFSTRVSHVAQSASGKELLAAINSLIELLEYMEHYKMINTIPLLCARKRLFSIKLDLIKLANKTKASKPELKEDLLKTAPENLNKILPTDIQSNNDNAELSVNKEKIIHFIKKSPGARTKDIIEEFSVLSARTVKRNLSELTQNGFLRKSIKNKAVFYSVI